MSETPLQQNSTLTSLFAAAVAKQASDIHIKADESPWFRCEGRLIPSAENGPVPEDSLENMVRQLVGESGWHRLEERGSIDGAFSWNTEQRFRFNIYRTGGRLALAFRKLENRFQSLEQLGLPDTLQEVCEIKNGLVLVAGPTGSGKSTTLATLIHQINQTRACHIVTIEDPVEYIHNNLESRVTQRQIGIDTVDFATALVDALRQDPDVILVGELRDLETIRTAISAAETGHLVLATVHAGDCASAIERLISVFPGNEQMAVRNLLATTLRTVITQHLLPSQPRVESTSTSARRVLASEILKVNQAAANIIANDNLGQLQSVLEMHRADGMYTLDACLAKLWRKRKITEQTARSLARNPDMLRELARAV